MNRSESIKELAAALAKAQGEMEGAAKDKENQHFRSKYADLGAVWEAIREPLSKHGLSVVQWMRSASDEASHCVEVETVIMHDSGEWMSDTFAVPVSKMDAHGFGSAATYARRYALMAACGIAPVDDDANAAVGGKMPAAKQATRPPAKKAEPSKEPPSDPYERAVHFIDEATDLAVLGKLVERCIVHESLDAAQKQTLLDKAARKAPTIKEQHDGERAGVLHRIAEGTEQVNV